MSGSGAEGATPSISAEGLPSRSGPGGLAAALVRIRLAGAHVRVRLAGATLLPPAWFVALAALVAFYAIDRETIWLDEATSVMYARQPLGDMIGRIFADVAGNMLGYQLILQRWVRVFGEDPTAVRAVSAVFAVISAGLVYALCRRWTSRMWALLGALVFVAHVMYVQYAQEARAYALMTLVTAGGGLAFLQLLDRPSGSRLVVYVLWAAAMAWVQFMLAFVLAAHLLHAVIWNRGRWRWWVPAFTLIALAWTPLLVAASALGPDVALSWIAPLGPETLSHLDHLAGGQAPLVAIWLLVVGLGLAVAISRRDRVLGFAVVWLTGPVILMLGVSIVQPIYLSRYMIGVLPAMSLLVARLGERVGRAWLLPTVAILGLLIVGTVRWQTVPHKPAWDQAVAYVLDRSEPGDSVVFYGGSRKPFEYYVRQLRSEARAPIATDIETAGPRLWLVMYYSASNGTPPQLAAMLEQIHAGYRQSIPATGFGLIRIRLYEPLPNVAGGSGAGGG